jgi:DNA-binding NtrC family response regulator
VGSILFVQADPDTHDAWSRAFASAGHDVVAVSAMRDALPLIREGGIEVVVIDSYDPRVGMLELARSIESLPDAPPLILVSGSPHAPEMSARIGAAAFVPKPCEPSELIAAIDRLLGKLRPTRIIEDDPTGPNSPTRHVS